MNGNYRGFWTEEMRKENFVFFATRILKPVVEYDTSMVDSTKLSEDCVRQFIEYFKQANSNKIHDRIGFHWAALAFASGHLKAFPDLVYVAQRLQPYGMWFSHLLLLPDGLLPLSNTVPSLFDQIERLIGNKYESKEEMLFTENTVMIDWYKNYSPLLIKWYKSNAKSLLWDSQSWLYKQK